MCKLTQLQLLEQRSSDVVYCSGRSIFNLGSQITLQAIQTIQTVFELSEKSDISLQSKSIRCHIIKLPVHFPMNYYIEMHIYEKSDSNYTTISQVFRLQVY